jgi:hypothetical protein
MLKDARMEGLKIDPLSLTKRKVGVPLECGLFDPGRRPFPEALLTAMCHRPASACALAQVWKRVSLEIAASVGRLGEKVVLHG